MFVCVCVWGGGGGRQGVWWEPGGENCPVKNLPTCIIGLGVGISVKPLML